MQNHLWMVQKLSIQQYVLLNGNWEICAFPSAIQYPDKEYLLCCYSDVMKEMHY